MDITTLLRKLAKNYKSQNLFIAAKDIYGVKIFKNTTNFSKIQEMFLSYLYFYHDIFLDISTKKITKDVLKCEIYEDAFTYWKKEKGFETLSKNKKDKKNKKKNLNIVFGKEIKFKEKDK